MIYVGVFVGKDCDSVWAGLEPMVRIALSHSHGELTPSDVHTLAVDGKAQVWVVCEGDHIVACAVTEVVDYARLCALRVICLAGSGLHGWFEVFNNLLHEYAASCGAKRVEAVCRGGLARMLDRYGYRPVYVTLIQEVRSGETSGGNPISGNNGTARVPDALHKPSVD